LTERKSGDYRCREREREADFSAGLLEFRRWGWVGDGFCLDFFGARRWISGEKKDFERMPVFADGDGELRMDICANHDKDDAVLPMTK
jgi:hypothetical protein